MFTGELDAMYAAVREVERANNFSVDLILCAGDFQAVRNADDLQCMACPAWHRKMHSFWKYHSGQAMANVPTIFVGGNHEASNHLQEIPLGGLVAPNIYFMGHAGVIKYRGIRIGGISGVFVKDYYEKKRYEKAPYSYRDLKTVYRTRKEDVDRVLRINKPVDVFISHDWPNGIWDHGNRDRLLAAKPFLKQEMQDNSLGNAGTKLILEHLQPPYWFAAHMHVKFPALVRHPDSGKMTRFLSLDKVVQGRDFIQILDVPIPSSTEDSEQLSNEAEKSDVLDEHSIHLDEEWLTILRTHGNEEKRSVPVSDADVNETMERLDVASISTRISPISDFEQFGRIHDPKDRSKGTPPSVHVLQPRTLQLLEALQLSPTEYGYDHQAAVEGERAIHGQEALSQGT